MYHAVIREDQKEMQHMQEMVKKVHEYIFFLPDSPMGY